MTSQGRWQIYLKRRNMKVTRQQLLAIVGDGVKTADLLHYINQWADTFGINTKQRMCHFLAQSLHETNGFKNLTEIGNAAYLYKYDSGKLAKILGNTQKGDGAKYRGRGLLMTTGRYNYQAYQNSGFCKGDIMKNPSLLANPLGATKSGMWWWWKHKCNELADKDDVVALREKINGGTNGLDDVRRWLEKCKKELMK